LEQIHAEVGRHRATVAQLTPPAHSPRLQPRPSPRTARKPPPSCA
jgi:hypothetical protein